MRITENRMLQIAAGGLNQSRSRVAEAGRELSSGIRVTRPSDDIAAWAEGVRIAARRKMGEQASAATSRGKDRLEEAELEMNAIIGNIQRAMERAVQMSNGTYSDSDRGFAAAEVQGIRDQVLAAMNARGTNGDYLFAGSRTDSQPFDAAGNYSGDTRGRLVETPTGLPIDVTIPGTALGAGGVDVLGVLDSVVSALQNDDAGALRASIPQLENALHDATGLLTEIGVRVGAMDEANAAREDLDVRLAEMIDEQVGADPVDAAVRLKTSEGALEGARAVMQQLVSIFRIE